MKISHFDISKPFELVKNVGVLVCENTHKFVQYCEDFIAQQNGGDGNFVIQDEQGVFSFKKSGRVITDYFNLSIGDKKLVSGLYSQLATVVEDNLQKEYTDLVARIITLMDILAVESPMAIDYNADFDISDILKAIKVCPKEEERSLTEKLIDYLDASAKFLGIEFFVLVNARTFFSDEDFLLLLKHIGYAQYSVLFLERTQFVRMDNENVIIIDNDLCEIVVAEDQSMIE